MLLTVTAKFNFFVFFLPHPTSFLFFSFLLIQFSGYSFPVAGVSRQFTGEDAARPIHNLEGQGVYLCPAMPSITVRRGWPYQQLRLSPA